MIALQPINTEHALYLFVEKLLHSAFPSDERRDDEQQRAYTDNNKQFHCLLIRSLEIPVGLLTYWDFEDFIYIEHFAIHENLRNKGYGKQAMQLFLKDKSLPVVLEVEMPRIKGDITHRRIAFYRRQGFSLRRMPYKQPPYRQGDDWLPMKLMSTGSAKKWLPLTELVRNSIYQVVYNIK